MFMYKFCRIVQITIYGVCPRQAVYKSCDGRSDTIFIAYDTATFMSIEFWRISEFSLEKSSPLCVLTYLDGSWFKAIAFISSRQLLLNNTFHYVYKCHNFLLESTRLFRAFLFSDLNRESHIKSALSYVYIVYQNALFVKCFCEILLQVLRILI